MRNRYGYYAHLSSLSKVPCPYKSARKVVTYFEGGERKRKVCADEMEAEAFAASLPRSAQAIRHSN